MPGPDADSQKTLLRWIRLAVFATGCTGIVAEYVLSTLASYLLGNPVLQWTMILSTMLFSMGIGSELSKRIERRLWQGVIAIELTLSLLCASAALITYGLAPYVSDLTIFIYLLAAIIGSLIGMEIPIITRIKNEFEDLSTNISSVMSYDYFGALLGGILFAYVALPHLGLTYTPIALGTINLAIAVLLLRQASKNNLITLRALPLMTGACFVALFTLAFTAKPIMLYSEQARYKDKIIFQRQTPYQKIVLTQYKDFFWLFLNGSEQFSSFDEEHYHEPLVHPAMTLHSHPQDILILGGGDGLAAREVLKFKSATRITLVDLDPEMTRLGQTHSRFTELNQNALNNPAVKIHNEDALNFLDHNPSRFDVIIIDLPDPNDIGITKLYTLHFYQMVRKHLLPGGVVVTQATSPYFGNKAFLSILKTMRAATLSAIPYHNHIPTLGDWSWILATDNNQEKESELLTRLQHLLFDEKKTRFLRANAMPALLFFGKETFSRYNDVQINKLLSPILYSYYQDGKWDIY